MSDSSVPPVEEVPATPAAIDSLYTTLKEASDMFAMLRQEPYFSTKELDDMVALAAQAKDATNWLRAQRDTAEQRCAEGRCKSARSLPGEPSDTTGLGTDIERLINLLDYRGRAPGYFGPSATALALRERLATELQELRTRSDELRLTQTELTEALRDQFPAKAMSLLQKYLFAIAKLRRIASGGDTK